MLYPLRKYLKWLPYVFTALWAVTISTWIQTGMVKVVLTQSRQHELLQWNLCDVEKAIVRINGAKHSLKHFQCGATSRQYVFCIENVSALLLPIDNILLPNFLGRSCGVANAPQQLQMPGNTYAMVTKKHGPCEELAMPMRHFIDTRYISPSSIWFWEISKGTLFSKNVTLPRWGRN